ncbi:conserved hypothetical protein [Syntrophobacter sp. SbD1]|nr:conserved hypothetical protein [Syntrophobacter sp. SbD1]
MKNFKGLGSATLIGSMPQKDRENAVALALEAAPEIPAWPQLPIYPAEQMLAQYIEGLPGLVSEEGKQFVRSDTPQFDQQALLFYEQYLAIDEGTLRIDDSQFQLGEQTGATFRCFLQTIMNTGASFRALKGQVVGPFTLLCGLKDQNGRALIYDERFLDIVPKLLGLKARWQIELMQEFGVPVIIFLDEPGLAGFGSSAFISLSFELVRNLLSEVVDAVHRAGGLAGVHVCANTDWLLAFQSGFDIINFDAYGYFDKFALYRKECLKFIADGGNIAWGIVPTTELDVIGAQTPESLARRWTAQVRELASDEMDIEQVIAHSLFTPSCGCGSLPEESAARVLALLKGFCRIVRQFA